MRPCGLVLRAKVLGGYVDVRVRGPACGRLRFGLSGSARAIRTSAGASASPRARLPLRTARSRSHLTTSRANLAFLAAGVAREVGAETLVRAAVEVGLLPHRFRASELRFRLLESRIKRERAVERANRERGLEQPEVSAAFRVPEPRRLPDPQRAVRPEDCLPVVPLLFAEVRPVRHRIDAIGIEAQGLLEASSGLGLTAETEQRRALVVPCRRELRSEREDFLIAKDGRGVVFQRMEDGALVDPRFERPRVEGQQPIVRFRLLLQSTELVQHGGEAHPAFLRVPIAFQGLQERVQGGFQFPRLLQDVTFEDPRRVVFRLELEGDSELAEGTVRVPLVKGASRGVHRGLEAIDAREKPPCGVWRQHHSFASDGTYRAHDSRHFRASSWFGFKESARSYASRASRNRSSCCRATPVPVHASALRGSRSIACSYRRRPICGSPPSIASSASCKRTWVSSFSGSIDSMNDWKSGGTLEAGGSSSSSIASNAFASDGRSVIGSQGSEAEGRAPVICPSASRAARTAGWSAPRRAPFARAASASSAWPNAAWARAAPAHASIRCGSKEATFSNDSRASLGRA